MSNCHPKIKHRGRPSYKMPMEQRERMSIDAKKRYADIKAKKVYLL